MINEDKISVIVPVYNVEKYIHKCVDSIINQDYKNLEIILIDDGSLDNCPKICDEYALSDDRIKVIHKNNGGLSDARNAGIDMATGEYVVFVDSDDYIDKNHISLLYYLKNKYNVDISSTDNVIENEDRPHYSNNIDHIIIVNSSNEYLCKCCYTSVCVDSKLFPIQIVKRHRFDFGAVCEDLLYTFSYYNDIHSAIFSSAKTYHYVQHKNSILHNNSLNVNNFKSIYNFLLKAYLNSNHDKKLAIISRIFILSKSYIYSFYINKKYDDMKFVIFILKKYLSLYLSDTKNTFFNKILAIFIAKNVLFASIAMQIIGIKRNVYI